MAERSRLSSLVRIGIWLAVWGLAIAACLSVARLPGDWGHSICGPWGCGPPLQALAACHAAWLALLLPPAVILARRQWPTPRAVARLGVLLVCAAIVALGVMLVRQRLEWWDAVQPGQRDFFWRRCGFVVATTIDIPVVQLLLAGAYLLVGGNAARQGRLHAPRTASEARSAPVELRATAADDHPV